MKIFDCFSYWDEDLLLDLRLNILNDYVDFFVIAEGDKTWQNNAKILKFNISKFPKFKHKIIYLPVTNMPDGDDPYKRENYQRNYLKNGFEKASDNDIILISDLDEIPNPKKIKQFDSSMKFAVFQQKLFYYKMNLISKNYPKWLGTRICVKKYLKSPQWLRELKFKKRPFWRIDKLRLNNILTDGGWHFCNLKNAENLSYKYKNLCETNDPYHFKEKINEKYLDTNKIQENINKGKDLIGRNDTYQKIEIDNSYPDYFLKNINNYKDWIA